MKIEEFDRIPLMSKVIYKSKEYTLVDRNRRTHEAILSEMKHLSRHITIRCSEIKYVRKGGNL